MRLNVSPRQSPSSAILRSIKPEADGPAVALDFFMIFSCGQSSRADTRLRS
jgi:hypothetical protein